jgi:hypothetical protein
VISTSVALLSITELVFDLTLATLAVLHRCSGGGGGYGGGGYGGGGGGYGGGGYDRGRY